MQTVDYSIDVAEELGHLDEQSGDEFVAQRLSESDDDEPPIIQGKYKRTSQTRPHGKKSSPIPSPPAHRLSKANPKVKSKTKHIIQLNPRETSQINTTDTQSRPPNPPSQITKRRKATEGPVSPSSKKRSLRNRSLETRRCSSTSSSDKPQSNSSLDSKEYQSNSTMVGPRTRRSKDIISSSQSSSQSPPNSRQPSSKISANLMRSNNNTADLSSQPNSQPKTKLNNESEQDVPARKVARSTRMKAKL